MKLIERTIFSGINEIFEIFTLSFLYTPTKLVTSNK